MAAVRPLPQQSIIECIPPASEIADLRILNKDLNFIQAMTKRADDLMLKLKVQLIILS